ncbi:hypothetical protein Leryth_009872 [Lithospermum erythrorhizon]|nr:hypothetical protein Leryth_009872 [Lithospermum erythrorhizon]
MESSRRPFDRSRLEPGPKKPRLANDEAPIARSFATRPLVSGSVVSGSGVSGLGSRLRERDTESGELIRGPLLQKQHQELVNQYKTALAELIFNSKPIITNLTIIAGENAHAAKAIAATICAHIIEVPSDQKLPSLYLLDSIVKNMGRDYIKHFAPKLPEVFCKAYQQVDPSIHPNMRHLFGTWKGVFPSLTLQTIEKELGFATAVNGSSSGSVAARPDSQAQRPAHSIYVNPKYLEARQRMQQSTRTVQHVHQQQLVDPVRDKNITATYGDSPEYEFELSKQPRIVVGKDDEKLKGQGSDKPWFDSGNSSTGSISNQRNGYDVKHGGHNYPVHNSSSSDKLLQPKLDIANRNSSSLNNSWKNSEEEEYMWDDMTSRPFDHAAVSGSTKDRWRHYDNERLDSEIHLRKPQSTLDHVSMADSEGSAESLSTEQKNLSHQMPSWAEEPHLPVSIRSAVPDRSILGNPGLSSTSNFMSRNPSQSLVGSVDIRSSTSATGSVGTRRQALGISSARTVMDPDAPSSEFLRQNTNKLSTKSVEQEVHIPALRRGDPRTSHSSGQLGLGPTRVPQDPATPSQNVNPSKGGKAQAPNLSTSLQPRRHISSQPQQHLSTDLKSSNQAYKPVMPQIPGVETAPSLSNSSSDQSNPPTAESPVQSRASSLLAAVMKSGILGSNSVMTDVRKPSPHQTDLQPFPPVTQSPKQSASVGPKTRPISALGLPNEKKLLPKTSQNKVEQPASSTVPVPTSSQSTQATIPISNPVSSLLSSLVAKGLITASSMDSESSVQPKISPKKPSSASESTESSPNLSHPVSTVTPPSCTNGNVSADKPTPIASVSSPQPTVSRTQSLIGCEFRPDVIRKMHLEVISELHEGFPHCCSSCGLQLRLKERLDKHLEWHARRSSEHTDVNKPSRGWYMDSEYWIDETACSPDGKTITFLEEETSEDTEQMVPADESQCVCVLCGELFEDFFSKEKDEWMFKGAVYLNIPALDGMRENSSIWVSQGPIIHATCLSESSLHDLGLAEAVKLENDT